MKLYNVAVWHDDLVYSSVFLANYTWSACSLSLQHTLLNTQAHKPSDLTADAQVKTAGCTFVFCLY